MSSAGDDRLSAAEQSQLDPVDGLAQLSFLIYRTIERRASEHDLSVIQARLLGVLRDRRPSITELAKLLELDKSSVSGLVDRAQRRGLVARGASPRDGRGVLVELTDAGRASIDRAGSQVAADVAELLRPLSPADRGALSAATSRLLIAHAAQRGVELFPGVDPS